MASSFDVQQPLIDRDGYAWSHFRPAASSAGERWTANLTKDRDWMPAGDYWAVDADWVDIMVGTEPASPSTYWALLVRVPRALVEGRERRRALRDARLLADLSANV